MRRRELLAGVGSLGVFGGAAGVVLGGVPSFGDGPEASTDGEESEWPLEVETIDARGSEAGTLTVPNDGVTVAMFFVTGCGQCQAHMPHLAEARSRLVDDRGDSLTFLSLTYQSFGTMPKDELRAWWRAHSGNWYVGYDDNSDLAAQYNVIGYPVTIAIDSQGEKQWEKLGVGSVDDMVRSVESVLEADTAAESEAERDANETTTA
ncbi:TlpA disulfide reductase family protein [Natrinema sp. 1APR25-10V2]|uniref:TlpA family protein disulfide reductase n=1 Tax=Natrinema sp. 1APR25-10V2 TaxID=2951081 RepID=UPI002874C7FD|nr:TlpA disulfide reductase family protein [Natrinema sp. 1APR25-10V2]MDS0477851.1 TlpA family protein disulfide reductase [Natrinema sp. 1APR25-10V2]